MCNFLAFFIPEGRVGGGGGGGVLTWLEPRWGWAIFFICLDHR